MGDLPVALPRKFFRPQRIPMEFRLISWRRLPWFDRAGQFSWLKTLCLVGLITPGFWVAIAWYLANKHAPLPVDPGIALLGGGNAGIGASAMGDSAIGGSAIGGGTSAVGGIRGALPPRAPPGTPAPPPN